LEEGDFAVDTRVLTGSNLNVSVDATLKGERLLLERFPEVIKVRKNRKWGSAYRPHAH